MNIKETKVTVFGVEDKGTYVKADLSEGIKDKDGNWSHIYWKALFFGKCKESAKRLNDKDKINVKSGIIENKYNKEKQRGYTTVKIFDFE